MKKFDGWQFPDHEEHLIDWMKKTDKRVHGRLAYQYTKYEMAMKFVKNRRVAVDVGSHIGLWAWYMAKDFKDVACFEPMEAHQECWRENMKEVKNADLFVHALGAEDGFVALETRTHGSSGDTQVLVGAQGTISIFPLDKFNLRDVDFMKIDCEGYELNVLKGAVDTITRCKPCIIVEQKGDMSLKYGAGKQEAVEFLKNMGYKLRAEISGDYILSHDEG